MIGRLTDRSTKLAPEEIEDTKKLGVFDFVNAIHHTKVDLMLEDGAEQKYNAYMVNRALSFSADTIFLANTMNTMSHLDRSLQFHFLINTVRPMKRYNKWVKGEKSEELELVKQYYGYSTAKAMTALRILTPHQLNSIRQRMQTGGAHDT